VRLKADTNESNTGLFRLVTQLIHRKFWFLGLFLWACWYWPLSIASLSDWSLLVLGVAPFFEFADVLIRPWTRHEVAAGRSA
jgi:hypothetical protein